MICKLKIKKDLAPEDLVGYTRLMDTPSEGAWYWVKPTLDPDIEEGQEWQGDWQPARLGK